jgi:hypothetical protein
MKTFIAFLFSLSVVVYWSGASTYAQSKGTQVKTKVAEHSEHTNAGNGHEPKVQDWQTKMNERFLNDDKFRTRMEKLLPQGMGLETAESGFKNHGQFIAALHVSKNLSISFDQLKAKMTGVSVNAAGQTTNSTPMSLGKAIHELRPNLSQTQVNQESERAGKQAKETERTNTTS